MSDYDDLDDAAFEEPYDSDFFPEDKSSDWDDYGDSQPSHDSYEDDPSSMNDSQPYMSDDRYDTGASGYDSRGYDDSFATEYDGPYADPYASCYNPSSNGRSSYDARPNDDPAARCYNPSGNGPSSSDARGINDPYHSGYDPSRNGLSGYDARGFDNPYAGCYDPSRNVPSGYDHGAIVYGRNAGSHGQPHPYDRRSSGLHRGDGMVKIGWDGQPYVTSGRGTNAWGNRWESRDYGPGAEDAYRYSNKDGSWSYKNPDGSEYINDGRGGSRFRHGNRVG